ncbi:MAG: hypothetical protein HDT13_11005 [Butyrivibrio sp.]|nr:hypothetical protein [Butyrivibrio sp.]
MDKHIKLLGVIFIISILMLTGCSKSSSAVDMSTYRLEFNSNIFREIDAELVYKIEYSLGGMDDVTVSDDAKIKEIISLFKNFDLTEKAPQEEIREGGTIVRITTSNGIVSFAMFGSEILGNGRYYAINEKIGNEADDLFKQLWTEHIREQKIKFSGSIFKNLDINSVYEITYDIGGARIL